MAERLVKYVYPHGLKEYKEVLMCNHPFCGGGITLAICDVKGDIYPCGCSDMTTQFRLGNVNEVDEETYINVIRKFHAQNEKYHEKCSLCDAIRICNFSCTGFKAIDSLTAESECKATKMLYSYLRKKEDHVISEIVQNMRSGRQEYDWRIKRLEAQVSPDRKLP
jgi:radical SAM protein with 4Fe4S-binding SPASM domain